ncbi:Malic enzyme [Mycena kentingensis (nom. inval.)]|nr:Malic enzyme [Mycena kentingensis (nom. inval.)]
MQGLPQYVQISFPEQPVIPESIHLTFQGGFVGIRCAVKVDESLDLLTHIFPEDINKRQEFTLPALETGIEKLRLEFEESSDFFGRITVLFWASGDVIVSCLSRPPMSPTEYRVALRGEDLLNSPRFNKGTAFTIQERKAFGLTGRLPSRVNSLEEQCERAYNQLLSRDTDIGKNSFLQSLKTQNIVLYYTLLRRRPSPRTNPDYLHTNRGTPFHLPTNDILIYPSQAQAISEYSHLFRRAEGLYLAFPNQDSMEEDFLEQTKGKNIDLIVVSDSEAILGIGDQGVGVSSSFILRSHFESALGNWGTCNCFTPPKSNLNQISSAKSVIYSLIGGINPTESLPVVLDVGTNNEDLLKDHLYVGWQHERVCGDEYDAFVDRFVQLVRKYFPHSLLHFEDFGVTNAHRLLRRYKDSHAVFNDDIQGTGAVTLSCVMAAVGVTKTRLADQRYVIFGAGSAGLGIARQLRDAIVSMDGLSKEDATALFYLIDKHGLIKQSLAKEDIREDQQEWVRADEEWVGVKESGNGNGNGEIGLVEVMKKVKPTVLIGCSTRSGAFTKEVVEAMAEGCERPIILPLSNPSKLVEVDPKDANDWTKGKALLATGSPFPPAKMPNGKDYIIAECNNALIYPGLGLGAIVSKSRRMTDTMIIAGARRLASLAPALKDLDDALLPDFADAPEVNLEVAIAVAEQAIEEGSADVDWSKENVRDRVKERLWKPDYGVYVFDKDGMQ